MSTRHSSNSGLCGAFPRHCPRPDAGFSRVNFPSHFLTSSAFMVRAQGIEPGRVLIRVRHLGLMAQNRVRWKPARQHAGYRR